jgi:hypothetical protein
MPDELHETFFHDSAAELSWWWNVAQPGREVNSDDLMPTRERVIFTDALLTDDFSAWQKVLRKHASQLAWRRRFQLSRYGIGKSR